jgi:hypothetical protein
LSIVLLEPPKLVVEANDNKTTKLVCSFGMDSSADLADMPPTVGLGSTSLDVSTSDVYMLMKGGWRVL